MKDNGGMFKAKLNKDQLLTIIEAMSDIEVARFLYCLEMAGTYIAVGKFENMLISAMHMCDRVKVQKILYQDQDLWMRSLEKKALLEGLTLGYLIKILEQHGVNKSDIAYLRWIKDKRDYFVHRLFHDYTWPGDLSEAGCHFMRRRLLAIQLWLERGERNVWSIFERAGFIELDHLADGSQLAMNVGVYDFLQEDISTLSAGENLET